MIHIYINTCAWVEFNALHMRRNFWILFFYLIIATFQRNRSFLPLSPNVPLKINKVPGGRSLTRHSNRRHHAERKRCGPKATITWHQKCHVRKSVKDKIGLSPTRHVIVTCTSFIMTQTLRQPAARKAKRLHFSFPYFHFAPLRSTSNSVCRYFT